MSIEKLSFSKYADMEVEDIFQELTKAQLRRFVLEKTSRPKKVKLIENPYRLWKISLFYLLFLIAFTSFFIIIGVGSITSIILSAIISAAFIVVPLNRVAYKVEKKRLSEIEKDTESRIHNLEVMETTIIEKLTGGLLRNPGDLNVSSEEGVVEVILEDLETVGIEVKREVSLQVQSEDDEENFENCDYIFSYELNSDDGQKLLEAQFSMKDDDVIAIEKSTSEEDVDSRFTRIMEREHIDFDSAFEGESFDLSESSMEEQKAVAEFMERELPEKTEEIQRKVEEAQQNGENHVEIGFTREETQKIENFLREYREQNGE